MSFINLSLNPKSKPSLVAMARKIMCQEKPFLTKSELWGFKQRTSIIFSVPAFMTSSSQIAQLKWPKVLSSLSEHLPRKSFLDVKSLWLLGFAFLWRYESDLQRKYFLICWPFFPRLEASATTLLPISNLMFTASYDEELASRDNVHLGFLCKLFLAL